MASWREAAERPKQMAMQANPLIMALLAACCATSGAAADRREERPGESDGRHGRPNITVEPYIDLSRPPRPNVDTPDFIMAEIGRCNAAGIRLFVDCLRDNHGSIMIRRLEACVRSETIPDDPQRVAVCLPPAPLP